MFDAMKAQLQGVIGWRMDEDRYLMGHGLDSGRGSAGEVELVPWVERA